MRKYNKKKEFVYIILSVFLVSVGLFIPRYYPIKNILSCKNAYCTATSYDTLFFSRNTNFRFNLNEITVVPVKIHSRKFFPVSGYIITTPYFSSAVYYSQKTLDSDLSKLVDYSKNTDANFKIYHHNLYEIFICILLIFKIILYAKHIAPDARTKLASNLFLVGYTIIFIRLLYILWI